MKSFSRRASHYARHADLRKEEPELIEKKARLRKRTDGNTAEEFQQLGSTDAVRKPANGEDKFSKSLLDQHRKGRLKLSPEVQIALWQIAIVKRSVPASLIISIFKVTVKICRQMIDYQTEAEITT